MNSPRIHGRLACLLFSVVCASLTAAEPSVDDRVAGPKKTVPVAPLPSPAGWIIKVEGEAYITAPAQGEERLEHKDKSRCVPDGTVIRCEGSAQVTFIVTMGRLVVIRKGGWFDEGTGSAGQLRPSPVGSGPPSRREDKPGSVTVYAAGVAQNIAQANAYRDALKGTKGGRTRHKPTDARLIFSSATVLWEQLQTPLQWKGSMCCMTIAEILPNGSPSPTPFITKDDLSDIKYRSADTDTTKYPLLPEDIKDIEKLRAMAGKPLRLVIRDPAKKAIEIDFRILDLETTKAIDEFIAEASDSLPEESMRAQCRIVAYEAIGVSSINLPATKATKAGRSQ